MKASLIDIGNFKTIIFDENSLLCCDTLVATVNELGQGTLKEEWELSSLERVWLEIFWRVNSAVAEARVLRFLSFIHWAGRRRGRRGRSRSPFIISGTLSGECSLQQPSSAHRMISLQTIRKDRLVIHQPSLRFELSSSYNVYPRKILFNREKNTWCQIVKYFQWYIMPSCGFEQWKPQFWV